MATSKMLPADGLYGREPRFQPSLLKSRSVKTRFISDLLMTVSPESTEVVILGAGVAGLALAQILRKGDIDTEVYERDDGTPSQGWFIGLDRCLEPLAELLPKDIPSLDTVSPNYASGAKDNFAIVDGGSHKVLGTTVSKDAAGHDHGIFAPRGKLREVLMHNLKVHKGKQCTNFEENDTGITTIFSDGTTARGTLLIGADGARSIVRRQLLENDPCVPSAYIMFNGNVTLPNHLYKPVLAHSTCGPLIGNSDVKFHLVLSHYQADETAVFNWNCSRRSYDYPKDDAWSKSASPQEILSFALQKIEHFPPEIVQAVAQTDLSGVQCPPLRLLEVALPEGQLPSRRITLLGDAAHAMVPFRGMGANTALLDACDLGRSLIAAYRQGDDLSCAIPAYEKIMVSRGREAVLASRAAGESGAAEALSGDRLEDEL